MHFKHVANMFQNSSKGCHNIEINLDILSIVLYYSKLTRNKISDRISIQRNPAIERFNGQVDFVPYCKRGLIANV